MVIIQDFDDEVLENNDTCPKSDAIVMRICEWETEMAELTSNLDEALEITFNEFSRQLHNTETANTSTEPTTATASPPSSPHTPDPKPLPQNHLFTTLSLKTRTLISLTLTTLTQKLHTHLTNDYARFTSHLNRQRKKNQKKLTVSRFANRVDAVHALSLSTAATKEWQRQERERHANDIAVLTERRIQAEDTAERATVANRVLSNALDEAECRCAALREEVATERDNVTRLTRVIEEKDGVIVTKKKELVEGMRREEDGRRRVATLEAALRGVESHVRRLTKQQDELGERMQDLMRERDDAFNRVELEERRRQEEEEERLRKRKQALVNRLKPRRGTTTWCEKADVEIVTPLLLGSSSSKNEEEKWEDVVTQQRHRIEELEEKLRDKDVQLTDAQKSLNGAMKQNNAFHKLLNSKNIALILAADHRCLNDDDLPDFLKEALIEGTTGELPPRRRRRRGTARHNSQVLEDDLLDFFYEETETEQEQGRQRRRHRHKRRGKGSRELLRPVSPLTSSSRFFSRPVASSRRESRERGACCSIEAVVQQRREGG